MGTPISTVGPRGLQIIFHFRDILASEETFVHTAMDECLQSFGYFHTKMAFSRGHLETNWFSNFLILLRVKQHVHGEYKLKFWIKNIH